MIVKISSEISKSDLTRIETWFLKRDIEIRKVKTGRHLLLISSSQWKGDTYFLSRFKSVESLIDTGTEYQLSSRIYQSSNTVIELTNGVVFGRNHTVLMAGPCAVESENQIMHVAEVLSRRLKVKVFRAGAFKPRTSPYSFQGLGNRGLRLLRKIRDNFDMRIVSEVKDTTHLDSVAEVADIVQIGTKSMYNFTLLQRCGKLQKPILLKRGFMSTIKEVLQAADFIISSGNPRVILCERGIRTFEPQTRFSLDICSASLMQKISHLPVVLDPSHAVGIASLVPTIARSAAALGVDGLLIEVHPRPSQAKSDRNQALSLTQFEKMVPVLSSICSAVGRKLI